jgi:hypothetical protein
MLSYTNQSNCLLPFQSSRRRSVMQLNMRPFQITMTTAVI